MTKGGVERGLSGRSVGNVKSKFLASGALAANGYILNDVAAFSVRHEFRHRPLFDGATLLSTCNVRSL